MSSLQHGLQSSTGHFADCGTATTHSWWKGSAIVAWFKRAALRAHDAQVRAATRRSLSALDPRILHDIGYLDGDLTEVTEILAQRYRDRHLH